MTTDKERRSWRWWSGPGQSLYDRLRRIVGNDHLILLTLSLAAGVAAAYAAMGFRELYLLVQWGAFGIRSDDLFHHAATLPWW